MMISVYSREPVNFLREKRFGYVTILRLRPLLQKQPQSHKSYRSQSVNVRAF